MTLDLLEERIIDFCKHYEIDNHRRMLDRIIAGGNNALLGIGVINLPNIKPRPKSYKKIIKEFIYEHIPERLKKIGHQRYEECIHRLVGEKPINVKEIKY